MANFIKSTKIKVFPAGFRKDALDTSKLTTEENLTGLTILSSDNTIGNRWITNPLNNKETIIYIKGYKFVFATADIPENCTWAAIQLRELGINNVNTKVLKPIGVAAGTIVLDEGTEDNEDFLGLGFYEEGDTALASITTDCKVKKDSSLVLNSSEIKNGTSDANIAEQFNTKKITVGSTTINENNINSLTLDGANEKISIKSISGATSSLTVDDGVNVNITSDETTLGNIKLTKEGADIKINDFNLPNNTSANMLLASNGTTNSWIEYSAEAKANTIVKRSGNDIKTGTLNDVKIWLDKTAPEKPILKVAHQFDPMNAKKKSGLGIERPASLTVSSDGSIQTDTDNNSVTGNVISIGAGTLIKQDVNKNFVQIGNTENTGEKVITLPLKGTTGGVLYDKGNNVAEWKATASAIGNANANKVAMFNDSGTIGGLAPTNHAASETTYGLATTEKYGHVKLQEGTLNNSTHEDGVAAGIAHNHDGRYAPAWTDPLTEPINLGNNTTGNLTYGATINIPRFSVDERGIVNEGQDISLTLPAAYNKVKVTEKSDSPIYLTGIVASSAAGDYELETNSNVYIDSYNNLYAPQLYLTSDKRLKENERPYKSDKSILDLPIYKYDYINGSKNQIGCMAQDLKEICPEIVEEDEKGYLHIQESKIVYLLIEEVKKLKEEIKNLKNN